MPLPEDVEYAGPEECEGEEDEEAVGGLAPAVLADQLPTLEDHFSRFQTSPHALFALAFYDSTRIHA